MDRKSSKSKDDSKKKKSTDKSDSRRRSVSSSKTQEPSTIANNNDDDDDNGFEVLAAGRRESSHPGKRFIIANYITDSKRRRNKNHETPKTVMQLEVGKDDGKEIAKSDKTATQSQPSKTATATQPSKTATATQPSKTAIATQPSKTATQTQASKTATTATASNVPPVSNASALTVPADREKFGGDDVANNNVYNYRANDASSKKDPSNPTGLDRSAPTSVSKPIGATGGESSRRKSDDSENSNPDQLNLNDSRFEPPYPRRYLVQPGDLPPFIPRLTGFQRNPMYPVAIATVDLPRRNPPPESERERRDDRRTKERRRKTKGDADDHGRHHKDKESRRKRDDRDSDDEDDGGRSRRKTAGHSHHHGNRKSHKRSHDDHHKHHSKHHHHHSHHHHKHGDGDVPPDEGYAQVMSSQAADKKENDSNDNMITLYIGKGVHKESSMYMPQRLETDPVKRKTGERRPTLQDEQTAENIGRHFAQNPIQVLTVEVTNDKEDDKAEDDKTSKAKTKSTDPASEGPTLKKSRKRRLHEDNVVQAGEDVNASKPKKKDKKSKKKKASKVPSLDITDFDSYYQYVYDEEFEEPSDREDEWLELSTTDYGSEKLKIKSFEKELNPWMLEGISYESQNLVREMRMFDILCLITGRKFYFNRPNFYKGHMDFLVVRKMQIPYFMSTFILWTALVLSLESYVDISTETSGSDHVRIEKLEIEKYSLFLIYVMANLLLVSVWSLIVVLKDCHIIAHYFNCWCAALADMETSSTLDVKKVTLCNFAAWFLAAVLLSVGFAFDYPQSVRGTSGVVSILLFRGLIANIRLRDPEEYESFQIVGLVFILYVMFCSRMLFCLMQILSIILKNSAEMWNFKFALTFDQLTLSNRGQMMQIKLNFPLVKNFTQHRVITALLKIYGEIFAVPISIYIVTQMTVFTVVLIFLFNYSEPTAEDYDGKTLLIYEYKDENHKLESLEIPYFNPPAAVFATAFGVLIQVLFDFLYTTEIITDASRAFFDGFEFVRRTNLILCENSHQRRVIQSLLWSMSSTDASLLTAANYYSLTKQTIASALSMALVFFSLIIQLHRKKELKDLNIDDCSEGSPAEGQERCAGMIQKTQDPDGDQYSQLRP